MTSRGDGRSGRRREFRDQLDPDSIRRKREDNISGLRKQKREYDLQQRRRINEGGAVSSVQAPIGDAPITPTTSIKNLTSPKAQELKQLLNSYIDLVNDSNSIQNMIEGTKSFRKLLSIKQSPPIQAVIETRILPRIVMFLDAFQVPTLQFEAAWMLTNVASGTRVQTEEVASLGAIPKFVAILEKSPSMEVREQAVWALGNIAGDSVQLRDMCLEAQALVPIVNQLTPNCTLSMQRNGTWALSNFCRGKPPPPFDSVLQSVLHVRPALDTLAHMCYSPDKSVLIDACWALSYLSDGPDECIKEVVKTGIVKKMIFHLSHKDIAVRTPALRTIGNIVTGDDLQTQVVLNCGVLPALLELLQEPKKAIRKEACWTISNITAGQRSQIQDVIRANLIPPLLNMLSGPIEHDVAKEICWVFSNITSGGSEDQIRYIVERGCIPRLCDFLTISDVKIVKVALEAIDKILRVGQKDAAITGEANAYAAFVERCFGLAKIEQLTKAADEELYKKAVRIIEDYWPSGDDEDEIDMAPEAGDDAFHFKARETQGNFVA